MYITNRVINGFMLQSKSVKKDLILIYTKSYYCLQTIILYGTYTIMINYLVLFYLPNTS